MQISKQLVARLYALSNKQLIQFFDNNRTLLAFPVQDYEELISQIMHTEIPDYENNIRPFYSSCKYKRRGKRRRWLTAVQNKMSDLDFSNPKHPFHYLYLQNQVLTQPQMQQLYGSVCLEDISFSILQKIITWAEEAELLTEFPLLLETRKKDAYQALWEDVLFDCLEILIRNYDGRINQFLRQRPEILLDAPLFSPEPFPVQLVTDEDGKTMAEITTLPGTLTISLDGKSYDNSIRVFDTYDEAILSGLISCITGDFYNTKTILVGPNELARAIVNNETISQGKQFSGGKTYTSLAQRIKRMASVTYYYETDTSRTGETIEHNESVFHLIDSFDKIETGDGKTLFRVVFSEKLASSIIKQQTISVTRDSFDKLESPYAKLLYPALQRERISLSRMRQVDDSGRLQAQYNHYFFSHVILFNPTKHRAVVRGMAAVFEALREFKEKEIAVADFKPIGTSKVEIFFYPLTEAEQYDFNVLDDNSPLLGEFDLMNE